MHKKQNKEKNKISIPNIDIIVDSDNCEEEDHNDSDKGGCSYINVMMTSDTGGFCQEADNWQVCRGEDSGPGQLWDSGVSQPWPCTHQQKPDVKRRSVLLAMELF